MSVQLENSGGDHLLALWKAIWEVIFLVHFGVIVIPALSNESGTSNLFIFFVCFRFPLKKPIR